MAAEGVRRPTWLSDLRCPGRQNPEAHANRFKFNFESCRRRTFPNRRLTKAAKLVNFPHVTLILPDTIENFHLTPAEVRLELACALYGRGLIGRVGATELAGVDFFAFQRALGDRGIPIVTEQMLEDDLASLKSMFPTD